MKAHMHSLLAAAIVIPALAVPSTHDVGDFDWDTITPSEALVYHDCYDKFQCARLQVPLDWLNASDTRQATIAMIKLPAIVPDTDETFGGPIFTNPGGPGGSGVEMALRRGHQIQGRAATPGKRNFEIISFDPRGIGRTLPSSDCFQTDRLSRDAQAFESRGVGSLDRGGNAIAYSLAMAEGTSHRCVETERHFGEAMAYVNTPSVARDMIAMLDKIHELRNGKLQPVKEEERLELKRRSAEADYSRKTGVDDADPDIPRLQYIGFSYGTVLGNYFASLFPGRVGRLVLDGVSDSEDYATGPGWTTNLVDNDEILEQFFKGCFEAGHKLCPILRQEDKSYGESQARVWKWIGTLDERPLSVTTTAGPPLVITGNDVRKLIGASMYKPFDTFRNLANILDQSMKGNTTELSSFVGDVVPSIDTACAIGQAPDLERPEVASAVICSDGDDIRDKDVPWWGKYIAAQVSASKAFGIYWSQIRFSCARWPFRPNWTFKGPFTTPKPAVKSGKPVPGKPAAPILFLSNRLDPVTPLSAARAMSAQHPGSHLVIQEGMGHCTANNPVYHPCVEDVMAEYLYSGKLPEGKETICGGVCGPWATDCPADSTESVSMRNSVDENEKTIRPRRFPLAID